MEDKLPTLNEIQGIRIQVMMECFFDQFWAFCEYMNQPKGKVETWKYADYVLYAFQKEIDKFKKPKKTLDK